MKISIYLVGFLKKMNQTITQKLIILAEMGKRSNIRVQKMDM